MLKRATQAFACVSSVVVASYGTPVAANAGQCAALSANPGAFETLAAQVGFDQLLSSLGRDCPQVLTLLGLPPNVINRYIPVLPSQPTPILQTVAAPPSETPVAPPVISESTLSKLKTSIARLNAAAAAVDTARARVDTAVGQVRLARQTLKLDTATKNLNVLQATERRNLALAELTAARSDLKVKQDALTDAKEKTSAAVAEALGTRNAAAAALAKAVNLEDAKDLGAVLQELDKQLASANDQAKMIAAQIEDVTTKTNLVKADAQSASATIEQAKSNASTASTTSLILKGELNTQVSQRQGFVQRRDEARDFGNCDQLCEGFYRSQIGFADAQITRIKAEIDAADKSATEETNRAAAAEKELAELNLQIAGMEGKAQLLELQKQQAEATATALNSAATASGTAAQAYDTAVTAAKTEVDAKTEAVKNAEQRVDLAIKLGTDLTTLTVEEKALLADLEAARAALAATLATTTAEVAAADALLSTLGKGLPPDERAAARELDGSVGTAEEALAAGTDAQTRAGTATLALDQSIKNLSAALASPPTTPIRMPTPAFPNPPVFGAPMPPNQPLVAMAMVQDTATPDPQGDTVATQSTTGASQTSQDSDTSDTSRDAGSAQDTASGGDMSDTASDAGSAQDTASGSDSASGGDTTDTASDAGSAQDSASGGDTTDTASDAGSAQDSASGSDTASGGDTSNTAGDAGSAQDGASGADTPSDT